MSTQNRNFISSLTLGNLSNRDNLRSKAIMHLRQQSLLRQSDLCIQVLNRALADNGSVPVQRFIISKYDHWKQGHGETVSQQLQNVHRRAGPAPIGEIVMPNSRRSRLEHVPSRIGEHLRMHPETRSPTCLSKAIQMPNKHSHLRIRDNLRIQIPQHGRQPTKVLKWQHH